MHCLTDLLLLVGTFIVNAQEGSLQLKYLGTAGWEISEGPVHLETITIKN